YEKVAEESGQSAGLHLTGGLELAGTPERAEWLKAELAWHRYMGNDGAYLLPPEQAAEMVPIIDPAGLTGALFDPHEGNLDPHGATHAYAGAARKRGAEVIQHNRVLSMHRRPDGSWSLETEQGTIVAEHVVNAGGLWARQVGQMVGIDLPLIPMQHHYLVTEDVPEVMAIEGPMPAVTDLEGFTYLQRERNGVLLGVYETNPKHWLADGPEWNYGMELIPEEVERIAPELSIGFERFPALQRVGIKRWVNGGITFTPDGNPLVGPVPGRRNYWAACGVMAGFSQGAGIGLALANWIADGDPGDDVFGMDITRFGPFATDDSYLRATTAQFYARRFLIAYPNEELPAGRPLKTSPVYPDLQDAGAHFGVVYGLEVAQYFAPDPTFEETLTWRRSNAHAIVAQEVAATREAAGLYETTAYARYEVTGEGAAAWIDHLMASALPSVGRIKLAPMLNHRGHLMGDLTVSRLADDRFWITGSYYLQEWHQRWFNDNLPNDGSVRITNLCDDWCGFSLSGPASREIMQKLVDLDLSNDSMPFLSVRTSSVAGIPDAVLGRISLTGELGYEVTVPARHQRALLRALRDVGEPLGMRLIGDRAIDSLRLEKAYGIWSTEFTQAYTPAMSGLDRFVDYGKADFIGREAVLQAKESTPARRLALLDIDATDADAAGDEGVWLNGELVGFTTSGAYGHHVGKSLALAYVDTAQVDDADLGRGPELIVDVVGEPRPARILAEAPYDPRGTNLRS
ncbi:MAG TPA: FAD-dependent oxidoreductase, partial [Actinomycetes bacterium]|nr:FAD-dependent oxidoreductase [Actinomycetes bacterium]